MRPAILSVFLTGLLPTVHSHYLWYRLVANGTATAPYQYVRNVSYSFLPTTGPQGPTEPVMLSDPILDHACNRGAFTNAGNTSIATLNAGDEFGFEAETGDREFRYPTYPYHEGPVAAYLSKAPTGNVMEYDGLGEWFKIGVLGLDMSVPDGEKQHWYAQYNASIRWTIPKTTPPGQYLLRMEQVYPFPNRNETQLYVNCAQVEIHGPGGGTPSPLVRLEDYLSLDPGLPGLQVSAGMWNASIRDPDYKLPGPTVWRG